MKRPLLNRIDRELLIKYNGKWGFNMPYYATDVVIRYNTAKIRVEVIRVLRLKEIVEWLNKVLE